MTATVCLDASTIIAWARQEKGWESIDTVLRRAGAAFVLPGTGLTEVIEVLRRRSNGLSAQAVATSVLGQGIRLETMIEEDHVRAAELLEVSRANRGPAMRQGGPPSTLSLSDASIIAVAERLDVNVLTADQHWADLSTAGLLRVKAILFPRI